MRKNSLLALCRWGSGVACLAALLTPVNANHPWGGYHWARKSNPFTLKLGDNVTSSWKPHLAQTSTDWNTNISPTAATVLQTAIVAGTAKGQCRPVSGTTQVCDAAYGNNGWLGLASIWITGGVHITQGTAKMNDTYFSNSYASGFYNTTNERQHVMCQEVAHTFGLAHQSENGSSQNSCMDYFSNTGANAESTISTKPNAHDFEQLASIYAHLDPTTTLSQTKASSPADDVSNDPNSWGMLVSQSASGRSSTYERYNQDGTKIVTHVTWTLEAASRCPSCDHRYDGGH